MLGILIDAFVLVFLLKTISDEEIDFLPAVILSLGASIGTAILAVGLIGALGIVGIPLAVALAAALLGVIVSALFGVEIKRAFLIGGIFILVHIGAAIGFGLLTHS